MESYKHHFTNKRYLFSFFSGFALLAISLVIQNYAILYTARIASEPVTDIILSNTRPYDVDGLFVYGALTLIFLVLVICLVKPQYFPFVVKSVAVFILVRSLFISLTHISPFPNHILITAAWTKDAIF